MISKQPLTARQFLYLLFAVAGAVVPWYFNILHLCTQPEPFTLATYFKTGFSRPLMASITADFFIGTTPVLVWMWVEAKRLRMKHRWFYLVFTFGIAFAFTCPLFLFFRDRKLQQQNNAAK